MTWACVVGWAWAQAMEAPPSVELPQVPAATVPLGPPLEVTAAPGDDLAAVVGRLPAGSRLRLAPGHHAGPLVVDRPLSVEGEGAVLTGPGRGTVLAVLADDSRVSGIEVRGGGRDAHQGDAGVLVAADRAYLSHLDIHDVYIGIDLRQADDAVVEHTRVTGPAEGPMGARGDGIRLWESNRNTLRHNVVERVRDVVVWYSQDNLFYDNRIAAGRYGIHFMHADHNRVVGNVLDDNVVGVFAMYSTGLHLVDNLLARANGAAGMGFGCKESNAVEVRHNRFVANTTGVYLDGCPHRLDGATVVTDNLLAYNHAGLRFHQVNAGVEFARNEVYENGSPVVVDGGGNAESATFAHNRWSEYEGYDLDGNGIGDLPYAPALASRGLVQRRPVATFFAGTPAAMLLDFLGTAFPMLAPRPLLTDPSPRLGRT